MPGGYTNTTSNPLMDQAALDTLLKAQPALWRGRDRYTAGASIPTGFAALDDALPAQGWSIGGVTELLLEQHGIGELSLLLPALRHVAGHDDSIFPESESGAVRSSVEHSSTSQSKTAPSRAAQSRAAQSRAALINPPHIPYAPAFSNAGIALDRLLVINSGNDINTLWATEQVLRSGLFGAVVAWVQKSGAQRQRRLQLAAESGGCWATVFRPLHAQKEHSPVATRICVSMSEKQLTLDIIKVRAGSPQVITIRPDEFDASQGAEWPVPRPLSAMRGIASASDVSLRAI